MATRKKKSTAPMLANPAGLVLAKSSSKLDLASGQNCKEGFEGVDLWSSNAKHKVDLLKFPWPFDDDSCEELHCSHFIEHIPLRNVEGRDIVHKSADRYLDEDMLFAFFDECYRILRKDGSLTVVCPSAKNERAFQDPTHRRFIVQATFVYLDKAWRESQGLGHYKVHSDWTGNCNFTMPSEMSSLHPEVQQRKFLETWNAIYDYFCVMKPKK